MILHRIAVEGFRCFRDRVVLDELDPRLNLLVGPNESGKSTIFLALHHGFFTPYRTMGGLEAARPWGTALAPKVQVDFETGGRRFRLEKTFLADPACRLLEWTESRYEPLADGDAADDRIREILLGERPGRGLAKAEHRGLARLLWVPQGPEGFITPEVNEAVQGRIRAALGQLTVDPGEAALVKLTEEEYFALFTKARGDYRKGVEVLILQEEVAHLEAEVQDLRGRHAEAERNASALEDLQADRNRLEADLRDVEAEREAIRAEVERVRDLKTKIELARRDLATREERFRQADRDRVLLADATKLRAGQEAEIWGLDATLTSLEERGSLLEASAKEVQAQLVRAREETDHLDKQRDRAIKLRRAKGAAEEIDRLARLVREVEVLSTQRRALAEELEGLRAPRAADVQQAREWADKLRELDGALKSAGLTIFVRLDQARTVVFEGSEGTETLSLEPGREREFSSADRASLMLEGVGVVEVRSGAGEIRSLREERDKVEARLNQHLHGFGVQTVEDLALLRVRCHDLTKEVKGLDDQIRGIAGDHRDLAGLKRAFATKSAELGASCEGLGLTVETLRAADLPHEEVLNEALEESVRTLRAKEKERDEAVEAERVLERTRSDHLQKRARVESDLRGALQTIEDLVRTHGGEEAIEQRYQEARREREAAQEKVRELERELPPPTEDPELRGKRLDEARKRIQEDLDANRDQMIRLQTLLDQAGAQGLYSQRAEKEEALALARARHVEVDRRARAVKVLFRLLEERRKVVTAALTKPIEERVAELFARVTGREGREAIFDEHLTLSSVRVDGAEEQPVDALSTGAKEQLFLITRLALGQYLAGTERMLFVLDDALVNTDPRRQERFLALLEEAAERLQIMLLTCHPERYRSLQGAKVLKLGE
ncbi:MAG: AAA family ATPase [candidate division NC10 bacterium]|nr:AAA family ATPase [candidate division NC10 bacterium]